jgi:hypothetical protein
MTCDNFLPTLRSNILKNLVFGENKSYFISILKVENPLVNCMTTTLKGLILNIKIDRALK